MGQARDEAGNIWETDAQGNAVRLIQAAGAQPQMPAKPGFEYEGPKAAADAASAQAGAKVDTSTVDAEITLVQAQAAKAAAEARIAEIEAAQGPKPTATEIEGAQRQTDRERKSGVVRAIMGDVLEKYKRSLRGQPFSRAFGATEKIDSLPANEEFRESAMAMLGLIRPMVAMGAKDGDSDKEMQAFLSYIPNNDDSDRTVESKLRNLERLISGVVDGKLPSDIVSTGQLSERSDTPFVDSVLGGPEQGGAGGGGEPRQMIPGTGGTSQMQQATGETYATPEDVAVASAVNAAYRKGGSLQEMIAASQALGRPVDLQMASQWQQAIDYRDGTGAYEGQPGGYSPVNTPESGRRSLAEQVWGDIGASGPGTFAINMADQWAGGGGLDEIAGLVNSAVKGTDYDIETAYANLGKQAVNAENPGWATAGAFTGGATQLYGAGRAFPGLASALTQGWKSIAGTGAAYGGVSGSLEANDDRLGGAAVGGGLGGAGGLFGGYVAAPVLDSALRSKGIRELAGRMGVKQEIPEFSAGEKSLPSIGEMGGVRANMEDAARLNLPYALADADPQLRMLAGSVTRKSPVARELAENTLEPRARGQAERAHEAIGTHLAPVTDIANRSTQWKQAAQTASAPYYAAGRQRAAPVDDRVAAFLQTPAGKKALENAREMAANEGRDPNAMGFDLNEQGEVFIRRLPSWETLDYVKRGIDQQLEAFRNPITRQLDLEGNPAAQGLESFRQRFVSTLDELNPDYAAARAAYAEQIKNREALQMGQQGPSIGVKPRDLPRITGALNDAQMGEYRRGYATSMADAVADTRLSGNPYDRVFGTPAQQEKVGTLFPNADKFRRTYDLEGDMGRTRYETIGGSPTAARLQADAQMGDMLGSGIEIGADVLTGGGASGVGMLVNAGRRMLGDSLRLGVGKRAERNAERIAPVLFDTNPRLTLDYLDDLATRQAMDAVRKGGFRRIGGLFGSIGIPAAAASVVPVG